MEQVDKLEHKQTFRRALLLGSLALGVTATVISVKAELELQSINPANIHPSAYMFPEQLPPAVAAAEKDIVSIVGPGEIASGFQYGNNYVVTAGHVIDSVGGVIKKGVNHCGSVIASSQAGNYAAVGQSTTFSSFDSLKVDDFSLLKVNHLERSSTSVNLPRIFNGREAIGSKVYFINYEPISDGGQLRNPTIEAPGKYSKPAIYAGVIAAYQANEDYVVMDNIKSYGEVNTARTIPGASGGPVFNSQGEVIGIVVTIMPNTLGNQVLSFFAGLNKMLGQSNDSVNLIDGLTIVEPITTAQIRQHQQTMRPLPVC